MDDGNSRGLLPDRYQTETGMKHGLATVHPGSVAVQYRPAPARAGARPASAGRGRSTAPLRARGATAAAVVARPRPTRRGALGPDVRPAHSDVLECGDATICLTRGSPDHDRPARVLERRLPRVAGRVARARLR